MLMNGWKATARIVAAVAICATTAAAQMTCSATAEPRSLRYYGAAEVLGDLVIECTGGATPSLGSPPSKYQIIVSADAPLTTPTLSENETHSVQWTEALLLVDDPSPQQQKVCAPDAETAEEEPGIIDCGDNQDVANVFQGLRLQDNAVAFLDTTLLAPGSNGKRKLRIVNLRANVRGLTPIPKEEPDPDDVFGAPDVPTKVEPPEEVHLTVSIYGPGGQAISIEGPEQLAGVLAADVDFEVRTAGNAAVPPAVPVLLTTPELTPQSRPEEGPTFLVQFSELSPDVFRRRNVGTNGTNPNFITSQAYPGLSTNSESGFFNGAFPNVRGLNKAGLADSGTRLRVTFDGVPLGVRMWFSYRDIESGTTGYDPDVPRARLTAPEGGVFRPQLPETGDYVEVWASNGHAEVLWEITSSDPNVIETLSFRVGMTGPNRDVEFGDAVVFGDIAPEFEEPEDEFTVAAEVIPSFDTAGKIIEPQAAFSIVPTLDTSDLTSVSAASYASGAVAPGSIVAGFGEGLAPETLAAFGPAKETLGTTHVNIIDSSGALRPAMIFAVGPTQVNMYVDANTRTGPAIITVYDGVRPVAEGLLQIGNLSPGLFSANGDGQGAAAGELTLTSGEDTTSVLLAELDESSQTYAASELDLGAVDNAYLVLYGSGIRRRASLADVALTIDGIAVPVVYAGEQTEFLGLDQLNVGPLPQSLAGRGLVDVQLTVDGIPSNTVQVRFR